MYADGWSHPWEEAMRRDQDWFDALALAHEFTLVDEDRGAWYRQVMLAALSGLERVLDGEVGPGGFSDISGLYGFSAALPARLQAEELRWAERLGERLWRATGTGRTYAEEALLGLVGLQASPGSLPFFRAALEANRERDSFQIRRRRIAVASVAFIAHQTGDAAAHALLEAWLAHPDVPVRTEAVWVYARLHRREDGTLEEAARAVLERVAYEDRAFAPRFLARGWLLASGVPLRVEPPDGVYTFKASLGRVSRTVELTASESLAHLASAILTAFRWDHDHLYEFALTGDLKDHRFVLDREYDALGFAPGLEETDPEDSDEPQDLMSAPLGTLGFTQGHKFIFRYDFGDDHRFRVAVADIQAHRSPRAKYPRVTDRTGMAPEQYPRFD
jgi:hypothetical protein